MCIIVNIHVQLTLDNYVFNVFEFQLSQFENIWKNAHIEYVHSYFYKHSLNNIVYQQLQEGNYKQSRDDSKYVDRWTWHICKCCLGKCMGLEHLNTLYPWDGILESASQPWGGTSIHNEMFLEIPSMFIALLAQEMVNHLLSSSVTSTRRLRCQGKVATTSSATSLLDNDQRYGVGQNDLQEMSSTVFRATKENTVKSRDNVPNCKNYAISGLVLQCPHIETSRSGSAWKKDNCFRASELKSFRVIPHPQSILSLEIFYSSEQKQKNR